MDPSVAVSWSLDDRALAPLLACGGGVVWGVGHLERGGGDEE